MIKQIRFNFQVILLDKIFKNNNDLFNKIKTNFKLLEQEIIKNALFKILQNKF